MTTPVDSPPPEMSVCSPSYSEKTAPATKMLAAAINDQKYCALP